MTNKERKENGLVYHYDDPDIMGEQLRFMEKL
jgi:galactoside O-acetyltransferase